MSPPTSKSLTPKRSLLAVDTWAVLVALLAALLIRTGIITRVPW
jgi:hypothetical protein